MVVCVRNWSSESIGKSMKDMLNLAGCDEAARGDRQFQPCRRGVNTTQPCECGQPLP